MPKPPRRVREPVQVYLDPEDRALLLELAARTELPQTEILRRGLRRLAAELSDNPPGASLDRLIGALGGAADLPIDLAARHDAYLYAAEEPHEPHEPRRG
jgi:hypothetical protein